MVLLIAESIRRKLESLTEGALLDLNTTPVLIVRENLIRTAIMGMPILPIAGDWGQGKSTLGKYLFRLSAEGWKNQGILVTYIPLATVRERIPADEQSSLRRFYRESWQNILREENILPGTKTFLAGMLPMIFSPNRFRDAYNLQDLILTTLPKNQELPVEAYTKDLSSIASDFLSKLTSMNARYIVILDELEGYVKDIYTPDRLGVVLWLVRHIYDLSQGIPRVTLILLILESAYAEFENLVDLLKSHIRYSRAVGVIHRPVITLTPLNSEEIRRYVIMVVERLLGSQYKSKTITLEFVKQLADMIARNSASMSSTRLKIVFARSILSGALAKLMFETLGESAQISEDLTSLFNKVLDKLSGRDLQIITKIIEEVMGLPEAFKNVAFGRDIKGVATHSVDIAKVTAYDIYNDPDIRNIAQVHAPTLRSRLKGFSAYQLFFSSRGKQPNTRIIIWVRLSRIDRKYKKEEILVNLGLRKEEIQTPTKILFIHHETVRGAMIQEIEPETIIPIQINNDMLIGALLKAGIINVEQIDSSLAKTYIDIYYNNYIKRVKDAIRRVLER